MVQRVLEVTLAELGRGGLAALSMPTVARRAGINKTSLYRRWPTREALVADALALATPPVNALVDRGSLSADLVALVTWLGAFVNSPAGASLVRLAFVDGARGPQGRPDTGWLTMRSSPPAVVFARAKARGELAKGTDIGLVLFTLAGAELHRRFVEQKVIDRRWAHRLVALVIHGISSGS